MKLLPLATTASLMLFIGMNSAQARPYHHVHKHVVVERHVVVKPAPVRTALRRVTTRTILSVLPSNHVRVVHNGETYYYHDGIYYLRESRGYVAVKPVIGLRVVSLPSGYVKIRRGRDTLYRFNDVYYRRDNGFFIVV